MYVILLALAFILPFLLLYFQAKWIWIQRLSPAFWSYALGITLGSILSPDPDALQPFLEGSVILAIPLMLLSANLKNWGRLAGPTLLSLGLYVPLVCGVAYLAQWIWGLGPTGAALAVAVYTGGTANMAAVNLAIGGDATQFGQYNLADLMVGGALLPFLLSVGARILRSFLTPFPNLSPTPQGYQDSQSGKERPPIRKVMLGVTASLGVGLLILGASVGFSLAWLAKIDGSLVLGGITLLGLIASTIPQVRQLSFSYESGEYLFLVFCLVSGAMIDLPLLLGSGGVQIGFMATVVSATLILHSFAAWIMKLDADTTLITQVAGIYGPPFIGPVATTMNNREIVVSGLTVSVVNLVIGNLVGLGMFALLS
ncbi:MAG: hypothetical protein AAF804_07945 [Bacteroidota bacterium]